MGEDRGRELRGSDVRWSAGEIHLPQLLNEEANADEFSRWEQVSSVAAERFVHRPSPPPARLRPLPSAFHKIFSPLCPNKVLKKSNVCIMMKLYF